MSDVKTWIMAAQLLLSIILALAALAGWISLRRKATTSEITAIRTEFRDSIAQLSKDQTKNCGQHLARTTALEVQIKQVPTHDHLGEIHEKINGVKGAVDRLSGLISGMNTNLAMLFEQHLEEGRKK